MSRLVRADLAAAEALGRVLVWEPDLSPDDRYVPLAALDLEEVARAVCERLGDPPLRMGWSAVLMGIASRLWSVTVAPFVADGVLVDPSCLLARHDGGSITLGVRDARGWTGADLDDLDREIRRLIEPTIASIPLSDRLLWGNVAASLHALPRVHHLPQARPVVERLVAGPGYAGELEISADGSARRTTCCLFYLVPGSGLCGDCVFDEVPARS